MALGVHNGLPQAHMDVAKQLGHTCNQMYENPTGLGPEIAHFNMLPGQPNDLYIKVRFIFSFMVIYDRLNYFFRHLKW